MRVLCKFARLSLEVLYFTFLFEPLFHSTLCDLQRQLVYSRPFVFICICAVAVGYCVDYEKAFSTINLYIESVSTYRRQSRAYLCYSKI